MDLNNLRRYPIAAGIVIWLMALAVGCGGDSRTPVYSGSTTYLDEREGQPVFVFEISISDKNGDPYTEGLLVESTAFTPDSSFSVPKANRDGKVTIILEASSPGEYRVAIESFIDPESRVFLPDPDSTQLGGKVVLTQTYAP